MIRISEKLTLTNVCFGKKIDKVSPYNEIIELPKVVALNSLNLDKSPFYLRRGESSPYLAVKEIKFENSILDGMMTWFDLN